MQVCSNSACELWDVAAMLAGAVRQLLVIAARTVASKEGGDDRMGQAASGAGRIAMLMRRVA